MYMDPFSNGPFIGVSLMFTVVPLLMIGIVIYALANRVKENQYNQTQPQLSVPVRVVTKRQEVSTSHHHHESHVSHNSSTRYFITFEFESGDRKEFSVRGEVFGMVAEEDNGILCFQGNEFQGFERKRG